MKTNVGSADRIIRIIVGAGLFSLLFLLEGNVRFFGLIGIIPLATALMRSCPLYSILGISSCPVEKRS
ncbi:MAG: DUF2892 domain-containing protein [Bacteroidia bacterium]|nr:DUF2892 domain-containing protein [Bacteroidia bacterium]